MYHRLFDMSSKSSSVRSNILFSGILVCLSLGRLAGANNAGQPRGNICSFDNANYTVGQAWHPFMVPRGYMPCIRCKCEWDHEEITIFDEVSQTDVKKKVQVPSVSCKSEKCKPVSCAGAYIPDGECCSRCPGNSAALGCVVAGARKRHGQVWTMTPSSLQDNQCTECSCMNSFVSCAVRTCRDLATCKIPVAQNGTCCLTCGCSVMGRHYNEGDVWRPELQGSITCVSCACRNSRIDCQMIDCPQTDCEKPVRNQGECCATCPEVATTQALPLTTPTTTPPALIASRDPKDCTWYDSKRYAHGTSWNPIVAKIVQPCVICSCENASINCDRILCADPFPCAAPVKVPGKCCAVCPGSSQKVNHTLVSPKSRRSTCSRAKYHWQVFEFVPNGTAQNASSQEGRATALFVLVDTRASAGKKPNVELHQLEANATTKAITVRATDASLFRSYDRILRKKGLFLDSPAQQEPKVVEVQHMEINTNESKEVLEKEDIDTFDKIMNAWHKKGKFDYIGTINEGRRQKVVKKERELCAEECLRGVQALIRIVRNRSKACQGSAAAVPPDTLLMLNEG